MNRAFFGMLLILAAGACSSEIPPTAVIVQIEADNAVRAVTRDVDIRIFGRAADEAFGLEPVQLLNVIVDDVGWPLTHTLVPRDGEVQRLYLVEATANDASGDAVAHVRAISGFVSERVLVLRLRFYSSCLYLDACVQPELSCGPDGECSEPAQRLAQNLAPFDDSDAGAAECTNAEVDCDDGVACTEDACVEGECVNRPDDGLCRDGSGGSCHALDDCQYPVCDATTCAPAECQEARCEGSTCVRTNACEEGAACCDGACCEVGEICCNGACALRNCNDMNTCTDDSCSASGCENVVNPANACDDGLFCTQRDACQTDGTCGGSPTCSGTLTCDESTNMCVGECRVDTDCGMPTTMDVGSCAFAPCSTTGSVATTTITPRCESLTCTSDTTSGMRACTRGSQEGRICGTESWSGLGPCTPCGAPTGTQTGTRIDRVCQAGSCGSQSQTATRSCTPPACPDAGADAGPDGGLDAGPDGGLDAGLDGGPSDAGMDSCLSTGAEICTNGRDDDCDGQVDCADSECSGTFECLPDAGPDGSTGSRDGGPSVPDGGLPAA